MMDKIRKAGRKLMGKANDMKNWAGAAGFLLLTQMDSLVSHAKAKATAAPAADATGVTAGISKLSNLVLGIIAGVGVIFVAKSVFEFASAYQSADSSGMSTAVKGIVGGLLMISIGAVLKMLGVTA